MGASGEAAAVPRMGRGEFVAFVAVGLALGAFGIDAALPALHAIRDDFGLARANLSQAVVAVFMVGVGLPQLLFGVLSDRFGRRPVLCAGTLAFVAGSVLGATAPSFSLLLLARLLQGLGAGAVRVVTLSIVRDRHGGTNLTRVMSLAMSVLLLEPILAPMFGQALLLLGSWRWILATMALVGGAAMIWSGLRLDESLPAARRRPLSPHAVWAAYRMVFATPAAVAGTLAFGLVMGAHMGFLTSAQAIFQQTFAAGLRFTPLLALISLATAAATFLNAFLVRRISSAALVRAALLALLVLNAVALALATAQWLTLARFLAIQSCNMFAFGVLLPNLTAMAINPLGSIAGTASALFGCVSTVIAAVLAFAIGQCFDGTIRPVALAYLALSVCALVILWRFRSVGDEDQGLVVASASISASR